MRAAGKDRYRRPQMLEVRVVQDPIRLLIKRIKTQGVKRPTEAKGGENT